MTQPRRAAIVAVAGRRIDADGSTRERFPLRNCTRVRDDVRAALIARPVMAIIAPAACGADLLALDVAGTLGIRRHVVLPFDARRVRAHSVADRPGDRGPLFDVILAEVSGRGDLVVLDGSDDETAYAGANAAVLWRGAAIAAAARADRIALIAWDGVAREGRDVTNEFRLEAVSRGWTIEEILTT